MIRKFHINDNLADVASNLSENKDIELEKIDEIAAQRSQNAFDGLKNVCNRSVTLVSVLKIIIFSSNSS